jgi:hypothetical protein
MATANRIEEVIKLHLKNTKLDTKSAKTPAPFLADFARSFVRPNQDYATKSGDVYQHYKAYVHDRSTLPIVAHLSTQQRFYKQFKDLPSVTNAYNGDRAIYHVQLIPITTNAMRVSRQLPMPFYTMQNVEDYIALGNNYPKDFFEVQDISAAKGKGVVATRDILKGQIILEYRGQTLPLNEAEAREDDYDEIGWPPALVVLEMDKAKDIVCIDPYRKPDGTYYDNGTGYGQALHVALNHSMYIPNISLEKKIIRDITRAFLVAKEDIPAGVELLWNYYAETAMMRRGDQPRWMFNS